jgi:uncharacterized protein YggT (Ycf19 family)
MAPFIRPFLDVLLLVLQILDWTILVWVVMSWILFFSRQSSMRWRHRKFFAVLEQLNDLLTRMTYPFLKPIRKMLRRFDTAGIDWSPLVLLLIIFILRGLIGALYARILLS